MDPCKDQGSGWWSESRQPREVVPIPVQLLLGDWESYSYYFHLFDCQTARLLQWYQENQQDSLHLTWPGIIVGTDGGMDWKSERMGACYVIGTEQAVQSALSICVGGPLSTLQEEAASVLQLLINLSGR